MSFKKITKRAKNGSFVLLNDEDETLICVGRWEKGAWHMYPGSSFSPATTMSADRFTHYDTLPDKSTPMADMPATMKDGRQVILFNKAGDGMIGLWSAHDKAWSVDNTLYPDTSFVGYADTPELP